MSVDLFPHKELIKTLLKEGKKHAELSASGSERWLNCPGSVALSREAPKPPDSKWSIQGTVAHHYLEEWLTAVLFGEKYAIPLGLTYDTDMLEAIQSAVTFFKKRWDESKQKLLIEEKVSLAHISPNMFGTLDIGITEDSEWLQVWDYKHGAGKVVDVSTDGDFGRSVNTQLMFYAVALARKYRYKFKKITVGVFQPRASSKPVRSVSMKMNELLSYEDVFKAGVKRVESKKPKLATGDWCYWCPAREHNCPKQEQLKREKLSDLFND